MLAGFGCSRPLDNPSPFFLLPLAQFLPFINLPPRIDQRRIKSHSTRVISHINRAQAPKPSQHSDELCAITQAIPRDKDSLQPRNSRQRAQIAQRIEIQIQHPGTVGFYAPLVNSWAEEKQEKSGETEEEAGKKGVVRRGGAAEGLVANDPFTLPDQDAERDRAYCGRLDMETRMRRRVYEQMFVGCCKRLRKLDGLGICGVKVAGLRDGVWLALKDKGLVVERRDVSGGSVSVGSSGGDLESSLGTGRSRSRRGFTNGYSFKEEERGGSVGDGEAHIEEEEKAEKIEKGDVTERWGAEDSFGGW